jgi:gamma-polyglutamate biosynthesis protein CapA
VEKDDYDYPFRNAMPILARGDTCFGNLESTLMKGATVGAKCMKLRADPRFADALHRANFHVVSIANNHIFDYGMNGVYETLNHLKKAGIDAAGIPECLQTGVQCAIYKCKGTSFGFLAYADQLFYNPRDKRHPPLMNTERLKDDITRLRTAADVIIVSMHTGFEYSDYVTAHQRIFAREAIDSGATVVLGHHPHTPQSIERYGNGFIFYSLGNFIFDQLSMFNAATGLVAVLSFYKNAVIKVETYPVAVSQMGQAGIVEP